jgi:chemotaxis signal transduction protein
MTEAQAPPAARAQDPEGDPALARNFMLFRVGTRWLGMEAKSIVEVAVKSAITRIPTAPRHVLGITSLRGGLVPVISLAQLLGSTGTMSNDNGAITPRLVVVDAPEYELALVAHEVGGFVTRTPTPTEALGNKRLSFLHEQIAWNERFVEIVDVAALATVVTEPSAYGD